VERSSALRVLAHPARLQMLRLLARDELSVSQLQERLRKRQSYVSQQLAVLRRADLVTCRREGIRCFYTLAPEVTPEMLGALNRLSAALPKGDEGCTFLLRGTRQPEQAYRDLRTATAGGSCALCEVTVAMDSPTFAAQGDEISLVFGLVPPRRRPLRCAGGSSVAGRLQALGWQVVRMCTDCVA